MPPIRPLFALLVCAGAIMLAGAATAWGQSSSSDDQHLAIEARQNLAKGKRAEARAMLEKALAERPNSAPLLAAYADTLTVLGDATMASAARFKACAFGSDDACRLLRLDAIPGGEPTTQDTLGAKCVAEGKDAFHRDPSKAVEKFECAVQAVPTSGYAHGALALALVRAGRPREAHDQLDRACELGHRPSCSRLELLADLRRVTTKTKADDNSEIRPTHTLILHDGRAVSGRLERVGGRYVVRSLTGTQEVPRADVAEGYALVPVGELQGSSSLWREGRTEWGLSLGYAARITSRDLGGASSDATRHILSLGASGGYFVSDAWEIEGFGRAAVDAESGAARVFGQLGSAALYHLPLGMAAFAGGPMLGLELGVTDGTAGASDLETSVGPLIGGQAGFKFAVGRAMALRAGLSLAYVYATGTRADQTSSSENRLRALFELELLWYPQ